VPTVVSQNADWTPTTQTFEGVEMAFVPAGCFMMGSDQGRRDERPAHEICFESPYWIGKTEVTNAQYGSEGIFPGDDVPRSNLTWFEARDFCASKGMRLPTEAEWEYAARGPDNLIYPWGSELVGDNLIFDQNSNGQTYPVNERPQGASWVGALDMSGNVFEWVSSLYTRYPYDASDGRENLDDTSTDRVFRSGINSYIDFGVSTHIRFHMEPDGRDWFLGFRCAKST
jgi:formylglycine-generating enzyme required for sulfatase activity